MAMNARQVAVWILFGVLTASSMTRLLGQELEDPAVAEVGLADGPVDDADHIQPNDGAPCVSVYDQFAAPSCSLCPSVYGSVESLFLERNNGSAAQPLVLAVTNVGGTSTITSTVISTPDLQFGFEPGVRALLGARLRDGWAVESSYLGLWSTMSRVSAFRPDDKPGDYTRLTIPVPLGKINNVFRDADWIGIDYSSQLHSVDLNLVCCRCCYSDCGDCKMSGRSFEWMAGFRYLNLNETLQIHGTTSADSGPPLSGNPPFKGLYQVDTSNNLYGAQLGARWRRCRGRWSLEATGKAGIYLNDAQQQQQIVDAVPNPLWRDESAGGGRVAFVGEISLSGIYQLTNVWGLRTGYNLLAIEGVALAPDQLDFSELEHAGNQLFSGGGVLLHGVSLGLEARW
ncbi:MAG: BBP7 family outer membrane beta-barrel protein [Planctomycetota bacterium]|nr:BBP7 family outer membrane beta-barrel protein [Planctomycetota bacterium]